MQEWRYEPESVFSVMKEVNKFDVNDANLIDYISKNLTPQVIKELPAIGSKFNEDRRNNSGAGRYGLSRIQVK